MKQQATLISDNPELNGEPVNVIGKITNMCKCGHPLAQHKHMDTEAGGYELACFGQSSGDICSCNEYKEVEQLLVTLSGLNVVFLWPKNKLQTSCKWPN